MSVVYQKIRSLIDRTKIEFVPSDAWLRIREIERVASKSVLPVPNDDFRFVEFWAKESVKRWQQQVQRTGAIY